MIVDQKGGTFVVTAKSEKSLDYREVAEILAKKQKPQWVEVTVAGELSRQKDQMVIKASVTGERFLLRPGPSVKEGKDNKKASLFQKLEAAVKAGKKVTAVTGKVQEAQAEKDKRKPPVALLVTGFQTADE